MQPDMPKAIGAGLAAAIALKVAAIAPSVVGVPLIALLTLPIALAGLITNASTSFVAAGVATLLLGVGASLPAGGLFALSAGLPAAFLVHQALLHRDVVGVKGGEGTAEWYPVGRIVQVAALIAGGVTALGIALTSGFDGSTGKLELAVQAAVDKMVAMDWGGLSAAGPLTDADKAKLTQMMLKLLPASSGAFWMLGLLASLWLAAHIAHASRRLARPWPDLAAFALPAGAPFLLALSVGIAMLSDGMPRLAVTGFAGAMYTAYVLQGLAIIHYNSRGVPWRGPALGAFYVLVIALNTVATVMLVLIGLLDGFVPLRRRPGNSPPTHFT